jgi:hypothetical protein
MAVAEGGRHRRGDGALDPFAWLDPCIGWYRVLMTKFDAVFREYGEDSVENEEESTQATCSGIAFRGTSCMCRRRPRRLALETNR